MIRPESRDAYAFDALLALARGATVSVGRMSYGVCISLGTVVFLIARQLAFI